MILDLILNYVHDRLFIYQCFATLTTFSVLRLILFARVRKRRHQLFKLYGIPGPEPRLLDGCLQAYRDTKTSYLVDAEYKKKYGKVFSVYIGDEGNVFITDLEILRKIFFEKISSFKERTPVFIETPLTASLLFTRYERWKYTRKIISPTFSAFAMRGQDSTNFIDETVKLMLAYIEDKMSAQRSEFSDTGVTQKRLELDVLSLMKATALKLITGLAVDLPGVQLKENDSYVEDLDEFLSKADSGAVILALKFPFLKKPMEFLAAHMEHGKTMSTIRKELNRRIDKRLEELANPNKDETKKNNNPKLIDTLIRLHHEDKLTRNEIIGNAEALLFAGYDTTSTTLAYIFYTLGKHVDIQEKLREELMAHGVDSGYLEQVMNETMRLYPTVTTFTSRVATENVTIDNLSLPQGTKVVYNSWLMHRDPDLWPEPEKFDPERFRDGVQIHPCAFAPFGMGERKCIGYSLAQLEIKTVVCDLLCRYRVFTKSPDNLVLHTYATVITKPAEKIILELERL